MKLIEELINQQKKIAVVGLGYVGLPLAIEFDKKVDVIGYDQNTKKIEAYTRGIDVTEEVGKKQIASCQIQFTSEETALKEATVFIIAVPTPILENNQPDLKPLVNATKIVAKHMPQGALVIYESTVYPGTTEEICIPLLEKISGWKCREGFQVGYSPERVNPGDPVRKISNIKKIVSGIDEKSLRNISELYQLIIEVGVHEASTIKVAEAAKVVENTQRDINIAFMNELAIVFNAMEINTMEVIEAMNTKWNALGFTPGLVGGHCIGVDPYYLIHKASEFNIELTTVQLARNINNKIPDFIGNMMIRQLIQADKKIKGARVGILGITFKENCKDTRNSKVIDIIKYLNSYGVETHVMDPWADVEEVKSEYGIKLETQQFTDMDGIVVAVSHEQFRQYEMETFEKMFGDGEKVILDVKGILPVELAEKKGISYSRL